MEGLVCKQVKDKDPNDFLENIKKIKNKHFNDKFKTNLTNVIDKFPSLRESTIF